MMQRMEQENVKKVSGCVRESMLIEPLMVVVAISDRRRNRSLFRHNRTGITRDPSLQPMEEPAICRQFTLGIRL